MLVRIRCSVVGDTDVGKTSLIHCLAGSPFKQQTQATVGVDHRTVMYVKYQGITTSRAHRKGRSETQALLSQTTNLRVTIWDTAGAERFRAITKNYYRSIDAAIVTFNATHNMLAIESRIRHWIADIRDTRERDEEGICLLPILLVGCKADGGPSGMTPLDMEHLYLLADELAVQGPVLTSSKTMSTRQLKMQLEPFLRTVAQTSGVVSHAVSFETSDLKAGARRQTTYCGMC